MTEYRVPRLGPCGTSEPAALNRCARKSMSQSSVSVYAYYAREKKNFSFFPLRPNTYMEITRIKEDVGYRPQYDIKRGRRVHRLAEEPSRIIGQQPFLQSVKSYRCRGQVFYMRDSEALIQETTRPYAHARQELVNSRLDPSCSPMAHCPRMACTLSSSVRSAMMMPRLLRHMGQLRARYLAMFSA